MRVTSCGITDVGMKRTNNEDNFLINDELQLFMVCDGMGGHAGGEYASAIAVNTVEEVLAAMETDPDAHRVDEDDSPLEVVRERLRHAIRLAGRRIHQKAEAEPAFRGMGTTALVLLLDGANAFLAHVGDSRAYLVRGNRVQQLTDDHSLVNERVKAGVMTREEARTHRFRNIITRSLGYTEEVEVDTAIHAVRRHDRFVLCSDGLSNLVTTAEIGQVVRGAGPQEAARRLVQMACERGGDDNITVVVVRVEEV